MEKVDSPDLIRIRQGRIKMILFLWKLLNFTIWFLCLVSCAVTSERQSSNVGAIADAGGDQVVFLNFVSYFDSVLNISSILSKSVGNIEECQYLCMSTSNCMSINVEIPSNGEDERQLCQLLSETKNSKSDQFGPSKRFHHFTSIASPCFRQPCQHGGTCHPDYKTGTFTCECLSGREGKCCEIGPGWSKVNINGPVCFGAKNDAYGRFTLHTRGGIISLKLVHVRGAVANSKDNTGANWGNPSSKIRIVITDDANSVVLPENYTPPYPFTSDGYKSTSPEIEFKLANMSSIHPPVSWTGRIWFVEDLFNYSENDNSGESCADVFLLCA